MSEQALPPPSLPDADKPEQVSRSAPLPSGVRGPLGDLPEHIAVILALLITVSLVTGFAFGIHLLFTVWMGS